MSAASDITLVTGGSGFLGRLLVPRLLAQGRTVRLLERRPAAAGDDPATERVRGDVTDAASLEPAMDGVRVVFNLAGIVSHLERQRARLLAVNVTGVQNVLAAARAAGVERVVHVSSVAAIGMAPGPDAPVDERARFPDLARRYIYATSKRLGEEAAMRAAADGLDVTIASPAFVIGAGDVNRISTFVVEQYLRGTLRFTMPGGLSYVDARDAVEGLLRVEERGVRGERYILGAPDGNLSHRAFVEAIAATSGVQRRMVHLPAGLLVPLARAGGALHLPLPVRADEIESGQHYWYVTTARAQRELGYSARPIAEAVADTVAWYRANGVGGRP